MNIYEKIAENIMLKKPFVIFISLVFDNAVTMITSTSVLTTNRNEGDNLSDFLESEGLIKAGECYFNPNAIYEPLFIVDIKNENGILYIKPGLLKLNIITIDLSSSETFYWREFNYDSDRNALRDFLRMYNLEEDGKIQLVPDEIKLLLEANI